MVGYKSVAYLGLLAGLAAAAPSAPADLSARNNPWWNPYQPPKAPAPHAPEPPKTPQQPKQPQQPASPPSSGTCHTASNRACWKPGFDINTDYELKVPKTGVVRKYDFEIQEVDNWVGPDGMIKKKAMLVNGQFPAPLIRADWGDEIEVTVTNKLQINGTGLHWHGIRQLNNNINDGVNGITECPIPPGWNKTYRFLAEQYGTTWYHSHFSVQYANGLVGPMIIDGPASLPYDVDLGAFPITDWYYEPADSIAARLMNPDTPVVPNAPGAPPPSDNVLFNGKNIGANGGGEYQKLTLTKGKRHRLRIINTSVENNFVVSLAGHQMTVIANDFVPVNAYTTDSLFLGLGQRYDVTIDASQAVSNYWFNVTFSKTGLCGTSNNAAPAAIFHYDGAPSSLPTNPGKAPADTFCQDLTNLSPVVRRTAPGAQFSKSPDNDLPVSLEVNNDQHRVYWRVNNTAINVMWNKPTLKYIADKDMNFATSLNVITAPGKNQWSFWIIENSSPVPHPMHLHGHDFLVLGHSEPLANITGASPKVFTPATDFGRLNFNNPARRDTTMLPGYGWTVLAFNTDNPGAWLFHCHIAWHVSQGLSVQFLERVSEIPKTMKLDSLEPNCAGWQRYIDVEGNRQYDSGL